MNTEPTSGLEGAVRLGYKKELEAVTNLKERETLFEKLLADYVRGRQGNRGCRAFGN